MRLIFCFIVLFNSLAAGGRELISHARHLSLEEGEGWTRAVLLDPWKPHRKLHTYYLVEGKEVPLPEPLSQDGPVTVLQVPVRRALVYSSVHCHLFEVLGAAEAVAGICDAEYNRLPFVTEGLQDGRIRSCGSSQAPSLEAVAALQAELILYSPYEGQGPEGRLQDLGIPFLACADYMETSPLGRAEWMKFYGRVLGLGARADSLFAQEEAAYRKLRDVAAGVSHRPTLFTGLRYGAVWHMSGGESTVARLFAHAGLDYLFSYLPRRGASPLSFETVFAKAHRADYWMFTYFQTDGDLSYKALEKEYPPYARFEAFRQRRIWACNTARLHYFEETAFFPHLILEDLLQIVHPHLWSEKPGNPRYFTPLSLD